MSLPIDSIKSRQITQTDFESKYFYKTELQSICRSLDLNTTGTKYDLNKRIINYLNSETQPIIVMKKQHTVSKVLTLDTSIIDGVKLNQTLRDFLAQHYHQEFFKFSKEMAVAIRNAKKTNDSTVTIQTLIDIHDRKLLIDTKKDDVSYQWNQFVKDFCADSATQKFSNKLKSAAILWKIVKNQPDKRYSHQLLKHLS
ncbi:SAP domain-containing protein [Companilactobacillus nantensis]|uniref:SAP domain-containing protein n=1 Tax=Companilactobacillus nantensis DSM 16982 TaxID=1423774 RepID=A0A0R1WRI9_9LACO|nr:SAP domain-containing protein [Companilactobacillus nantensis]KRM17699.1 hypothetical protein FD31_GL002458 [Companilactobacillus nantensis DSM 16982]GEO63367.1 hypothetical protein LNA01_05500 [Companilactobacillus nantensis]